MKNLLALICLWALPCIALSQTDFFVSPNGNNSNSGSISSPWKDIQYGINNLRPGQTLNIREGSYSEKIDLSVSGSKNSPITIKAYENEDVIIDGDAFNDNRALFFAYEKNNFTVEGIHFTNLYYKDGAGAFNVYSSGENIKLINCTFSNIAISRDPDFMPTYSTNQPVVTFIGTHPSSPIQNVLVSGIEIYDCRPGYSECLSISGNAEDFEFSNNYIHDNANIGIDAIGNYGYCPTKELDQARNGIIKNNICHDNRSPVAAAGGIYIDGGKDIIIENNIMYNNDYGAEIGCEESGSSSNIIFRNNLVYNNFKAGIALGGYSEATGGKVTYSKIMNNTFYNNDRDGNGHGELFVSQLENSEISNNIIYTSDQNLLMTNYRNQPNLNMNYNLIYCNDGENSLRSYWNNQTVTGVPNVSNGLKVSYNNSNFFSNPNFIDIYNADFSLAETSNAINAGNPEYQPTDQVDIMNKNRVSDGIIDCGACEYQGTLSIQNTIEPLLVKAFPNPTVDEVTVSGNFKNYNVKLIAIDGKLIKEFNNVSAPHKISLKQLNAATYFLILQDNKNNSLTNYRIVKK